MKTGILVVAAGTLDPRGKVALDRLAQRAQERSPAMDVRWAYTAAGVRKRLAAEDRPVLAPAEALSVLVAEGFTHLAIWSLHVIPGREFHELVIAATAAERSSNGSLAVSVGRPLLSSYDDVEGVADAVLAELPTERKKGDAVILVGHGNAGHPADLAYAAAAYVLATRDARVFVATTSGRPGLGDLLPQCRASGVTRAFLLPFTTVAGSTVREVVTESGEKSWQPEFSKAGIEAIPVMQGLAERAGVADIWLDHLDDAIGALATCRVPCGEPRAVRPTRRV